MRVLITRPEPEAIAFADRLVKLGHDPVSIPVLWISEVEHPTELPPDLAAVLFTSTNAIRGFRGKCAEVPVFVPGKTTAAVAGDHGWTDVRVAGGNAATLMQVVRDTINPNCGTLLYLRGHDVAFPLGKEFAAHGYLVEERNVYRADPISALPTNVAMQLASGQINTALFFSVRTAVAFSLLLTPEIRVGLKRVRALAFSERIAAALPVDTFASVEVAAQPNGDALLEILEHPTQHR